MLIRPISGRRLRFLSLSCHKWDAFLFIVK